MSMITLDLFLFLMLDEETSPERIARTSNSTKRYKKHNALIFI